MMEKKYIFEKKLPACSSVTPGWIARQMETVMEMHMNTIGFSFEQVKAMGCLAVIARTQMQIFRLPVPGETVTVRTWQGKEKFWLIPRFFDFLSDTGELLIQTTSEWLFIDAQTRRMVQPPTELELYCNPNCRLRMKPPVFPETLSESTQRTVTREEIDHNGHMNNAHYLDWALDILNFDAVQFQSLKSVWIEYCQELKENDCAIISYERKSSQAFLKGYVSAEHAFTMTMSF